jgi:hypothetical protein
VLKAFSPEECFFSSQVGTAEGRIRQVLGMAPVRPTSAVSRRARLHLRQILVLDTEVAAGGTPHAYAIFYLFGAIPKDSSGLPDPTSRASRYLVVSEFIGRLDQSGVTIGRGIGVLRIFARSSSPPTYQPWNLDANLPGRNLALHVTSNTSRKVVKAVGQQVIVHSGLGR